MPNRSVSLSKFLGINFEIYFVFMKKVFENILVPYDDSPNSKRVLSKAFALAELSDSTITLVHVISYHKAMGKIVEPKKESIINHVKNFF